MATGGAADLEEIIVTAARQSVSTYATPLSISRVDGDAIKLVGATHSSEILNRVPGALVQRGSGEESLTAIRSPVVTGAGSCGAFLFLENGVPIRPVGFCNVNEMLEINTEQADAIEVIRGTGTALYGSNAVHGTVNVLQAAPEAMPQGASDSKRGPPTTGVSSAAGSHTGASTEFGAKALYTHDGGWRDDSGFDEAKLNATLTTIASTYSLPLRFDLAATWLEQETAGFIIGQGAIATKTWREVNPNPEAFRNAQRRAADGRFSRRRARPGSSDCDPTCAHRAWNSCSISCWVNRSNATARKARASCRVLPGTRVRARRYITGVDLEWADAFLLEVQDGPTTDGSPAANAMRPAGKHYDYSVTSNVAALYGQFEYALSGKLHAGIGLRAEYIRYDYDNHMLAGNTRR